MAPWACNLCSHTGPCALKRPTFGLMLCFCYPKILNNFVFELAFCKSGLMGLERVHDQRRFAQYTCLPQILMMPYEHRLLVDPQSMGSCTFITVWLVVFIFEGEFTQIWSLWPIFPLKYLKNIPPFLKHKMLLSRILLPSRSSFP